MLINYTISAHAKQRYAERIMGKDDTVDVNRFVTTNEEKIKTDINKLIQYGEKIYSGKHASKDSKGSVIDVYLKDCWVILVDNKSNNVVTLFKVDLGLDDEFNKTYVDKMVEKLHNAQGELEEVQNVVSEESASYHTTLPSDKNRTLYPKSSLVDFAVLLILPNTFVNSFLGRFV